MIAPRQNMKSVHARNGNAAMAMMPSVRRSIVTFWLMPRRRRRITTTATIAATTARATSAVIVSWCNSARAHVEPSHNAAAITDAVVARSSGPASLQARSVISVPITSNASAVRRITMRARAE